MEEGLVNPHISPDTLLKIEEDRRRNQKPTIDFPDLSENRKAGDVKILQPTRKLDFKDVLSSIILLQNNHLWKLLLLTFLFVDYTVEMYQISFLKRMDRVVLTVEIIADILFLLNYLCLLTMRFWKRLHLLMGQSPKSIFRLTIDGLLVIPYDLVYYLVTKEENITSIHAFQSILIPFIRLYYFEEYFSEKANMAGVKHWNYFVAKYILHLFWFTHTIACILFLLACPFDCKQPTGWASLVKKELDTNIWFINASYMAFMYLTNCGFGDFLPTNHWERLLSIITMCCGFGLTTLILIGAMSSDMVNKSYRLANLRIQLRVLKEHLKMIGMSKIDTNNVINYFNLFWEKKKGVKEVSAIKLLPLPLQMEISFDINYYQLKCSPLFRDKPEPFLRALSLNMKHEFFQPGEIIYKCNAIKIKMICVASGIIEITSDEDFESPIISFGRGSVLGEAALILSLPTKTTVRAANYCELQALYKVDFVQIINLFPEVYLQLRETILGRIDNFRHDEYKLKKGSKFKTLNLYVSQKMNIAAIPRIKKRLLNEPFDDVIPKDHHSCEMYNYSRNVKKQRGNYIALRSKFPWILSPESSFSNVWEIVMLLDILIIGFVYPYFITYYREFPHAVVKVSFILELFYFVDLYIILMTAIEGKDYIIKEPNKILIVHLRSFKFYLELFSTLPIEFFFFHSSNRIYYTMKINRLCKCFRIYTYFAKIENRLTIANILTTRLIKYVIYIVLGNYWYGLLLYSSTCFSPFCKRDGWYRKHLLEDQKKRLATPCSSYPTLMSTYFGLTVLTTIGFDDITPGNIPDMILMMLGALLGIFLFGYCTSELAATIAYNIQIKIDFQTAMFAVEKFLKDNHMNVNIIKRVMKFIELQWYYNKGVHFWKNSLLRNVTGRIEKQVLLKERLQVIRKITLFQEAEEKFVELIAAGSRTIVLPPNEVVIYPGGASRDLYVIEEGFCSRELEPGNEMTIGPGSEFGTRNLLFGWPNIYKVATLTHVKLIAISDTLFNSTISQFPTENAIIQNATPPQNLEMIKNIRSQWDTLKEDVSPKIQKIKKFKFMDWLRKSISESVVYVPAYCRRHNEDYNKPFEALGFFYKLKYLLLPISFLPQGLFLKIWVAIRFPTAVLFMFLTPYQLTQTPYIPELDPIMMIMDIIAYADLYILLLVSYYGDKNQLIIHPYKTASNYIRGMFLPDLLICFPWEVLVKYLVPEHNEGHSEFGHQTSAHWRHCSVRLIKILQIYRLPRFFIYIESNIRVTGLLIQVVKFLPFTIIFLNICSALIVITSCKYYHITELDRKHIVGTIATPPGMGSKQIREYTMFCKRDSWIERSKFHEFYTPQAVYMLAVYFTTTILTGCGFGDITPQDTNHLVLISIMMMCATFFFGYVFAYISSYTSDLHSVFSIYQGMVAELKRYFQIESVSKKIRELSLSNASYRWSRGEGMEPNIILSILHPALHEDAVLHLYENTLKDVPLFEGVDKTFFRIIGKVLRERYYIKGSCIFREDDAIDTIFIVHRGKLEIKFYHNYYEEMVTYIGVGGILGNLGNQVKSRMLSTAIAVTNVDTLYLKSDEFYRILNKYPDIRKKVDMSFSREQHKDFCIPITMIEEESDSSIEIYKKRVSIDIESQTSYSSTGRKMKSDHRGTKFQVVEKEWMILLFIFAPVKWFKAAIYPESTVLHALETLCVIGGYCNSFLVMYQFSFQDFHIWVILLMFFIDITFIWHIFLELHTAYLNRFSDYVIDNKKIKKKYFSAKKRRIIDFLANMPFPYIAFLLPLFFNVSPYTTFSFLKLFSLLRIWFLFAFFNSKWVNLIINRLVVKFISVFISISLIIHAFSCIWYIFACPIFVCYRDSWVKVFYQRKRSQFQVYIICVYFISGVCTSTGIGDITGDRYNEILFSIILMLTTKFLIGIFIGVAVNIISLHSSFLISYEEKIFELRDYFQNENVSDHQMEKMWNYVKQLWAKRNGRQIPRIVTNTMSYTNQCGLKYDVYGEELRNSYLFKDLEQSFLRQLSIHINPVMFFPGNYIVQHGDSDQSMYFIHRGEVDVLTVHPSLRETIHDVLHTGEMFGLPQGLYHGIPHYFSYRAKTTVDIGVLQLKDWTDLMLLFPRAKESIYKRALDIHTIL